VKDFILAQNIDMLIVGPEEPLVRGIYDFCENEKELAQLIIVGPSREGAQLEGSKAYAKKFMADYGIPTAAYRPFNIDNIQDAFQFIDRQNPPIVLKADGLAAGKGVLIIDDKEEAKKELRQMLQGKFGAASAKVVIEAFLDGIEFSVFVLTDGKDYQILPVAKDYKRIGEGDQGPNTGGMGAVSPPPFVDDKLMQKVKAKIIEPTIHGLMDRNIDYKGFIFFGLINVDGEPFVIEYNCRMGDPETEVVIPRIQNDLPELFIAMHKGKLAEQPLKEDPRAAATVMLVSGGYPGTYEKGKVISGLAEVQNSILFHAGTKQAGDALLTNGGRVLAITSYGEDFKEAVQQSQANAQKINFEGKYFRKDIGFDL
ncbi:MAG TPA: phosphoribosylamine--glycine ligase, partial [Phaeodactylibacter sp.]|nr:phosphoribosylamine--glycine ligase [Phaeodactylibacter sp.]